MEPVAVRHAELERVSEKSAYKSKCPKCVDGILAMRRDVESFKLSALDFCLGCGQAFWYEDIDAVRSRNS